MSDIFNEKTMYEVMNPYVPEGETLQAAVHVIGKECKFFQIFTRCECDEDALLLKPGDGTVGLAKGKYAIYDAYVGITENSIVICDYPVCKYFYGFEHRITLSTEEGAMIITDEYNLRDYGKCFPLDSITNVSVKKGMLGVHKCKIEFGEYGYVIMDMPNRAGVLNGMPHHKEYKEAILARLGNLHS